MDWKIDPDDLKRYPHFDKYLSIEEIENIVKDPKRVKENSFFPFLRYTKTHQPFRHKDDDGKNPEKKSREIRYASRRDAYIFSYYRHLISNKYNAELTRLGLADCVIAYRKIPVHAGSDRGKCNINFAKDAFDKITAIGNCSAVVLDISKYFESLDHVRLRDVWCRLFGFSELPPDHAAVFKNITKYRFVDRDALYERLSFIGIKHTSYGPVRGYLKGFKEIPNQLCDLKTFREKVAGGSPAFPSIIQKNSNDYGIPQGAPISDVLANIYLIDFDCCVKEYVDARGGLYMRYSDDIIVIVPGTEVEGLAAREFVRSKIAQFGDNIQIKLKKCSLVQFFCKEEPRLGFKHIEGDKGHNGLEYLGFRFDGRNVYLKDSTLSGLYRKITRSLRKEVFAFIARYPGKDSKFLIENFDAEKFIRKFGRVEEFDSSKECKDWTFWTYARRAHEEFGDRGTKIMLQMKKHRSIIKSRIIKEFEERAPSS